MYSTKTYQIDVPTHTWEEFKQLHADRDRINSAVVELVAEYVREETNGDLEPQVRRELNRILGGDDGL